MDTPLGRVTHEYLWVDGLYFRRLLFGPARWERWAGRCRWQAVDALPAAA